MIDSIREISLTRGYVALVDAADYDDLARFEWRVHVLNHGQYALRNVKRSGKRTTEYMHRFLIPNASLIDHINHDGLDNRRRNLRPATHTENQRNRAGLEPKNTSGFRGVSWNKSHHAWRAQIKINGRQKFLGQFAVAEDAARASDAAAIEHYGEFAGYLNFPREDVQR